MSRRRVVLYVSLGLLTTLIVGAAAGILVLTRSGWGQDHVRRLVEDQVTSAVHGRVYFGRISGSYLSSITIDSLEIRDAEDSLFVASGPVTLQYDVRDIIDKRLLFNHVDMQHPTVYLRQHENWDWNFWRIFRHGQTGPKSTGPQYGDYVVLDSVRLHHATFELTQPWHPDDSLHGVRRDSAIAAALANKDIEIRRSREGFAHTRRWTDIEAVVPYARLNDPDSAGRLFVIDSIDAIEQDPPFRFRNVAGVVRNLGDSVWLNLSRFSLPGSRGSASGKVWWGQDLPPRYDLRVVGDTVSLADVDWIYPTLPTTGGGTVVVDIHNERDLNVMDYKLTKLDVHTTKSHLRGAMTFGVGGPVLQVKDVNLVADPMDFDLLRTFNGKPLPVDWQGQIRGTVVGRGGPLTHFVVDSSHFVFDDAHVAGATSELGGKGELNILQPALTEFHHFTVAAKSVDLRTVEFLYPSFPRLNGQLSGSATLDSSWLDVRFSNADVRYHDGDAPPSRLYGTGRLTYGELYTTYDASLFADSLSLTGLRRSYPKLPVRGMYSGTIRVQGQLPDLFVDASLRGAGGAFTFNGHLDADPPSVGVHGSGRFVGLDPARVLAADSVPSGSITGNYEMNLTGDSVADLDGSASLRLERSEFDKVHVFGSAARLRFGDGRMSIDTLYIETSAARVIGRGGALGLHAGIVDTFHYEIHVDSLGGLRPFLASRAALQSGKPDSLLGTFDLDSGVVAGNLDVLSISGRGGHGAGLYINKDRGASAKLNFSFDDVLRAPRGFGTLTLDTLVVSGVRVDTIGFTINLSRATAGAGLPFAGSYAVGALSDNGPTFSVGGMVSHAAGTTTIGVDSASVAIGADLWRLSRRGLVSFDSSAVMIDTLTVVNGHGGVLSVAGHVPVHDAVAMRLRGDSLPVRDLATLLQIADTMSGWSSLNAEIAGTRDAPAINLAAAAHSLRYGSMQLDSVEATGTYGNRRTTSDLRVFAGGRVSLEASASLPMEIQLFSGQLLDDSLSGQIRADSADFAIVEAFVPNVSKAKGRVFVALDVGGTWAHPTIGGDVQMHDAQLALNDLGITLHGLSAEFVASAKQDSVAIRQFRAWSTSPADSVWLDNTGFISFADRSNPSFNLRLHAHEFRAMDKRSLARLDISTGGDGIALIGRESASTVTGAINIVRGTIYIPEHDLAKKQMVQLSYADLREIGDTIDDTRIKLPSPPSALRKGMTVKGLSVTLGDEVWLRSQEVNIKLVGALTVQQKNLGLPAAANGNAFNSNGLESSKSDSTVWVLDGTLTAERGTYTLSLGPIQREFQVQTGTITFYGTPDPNPRINVTAVYVVRQSNRPDVTVQATLSGFLYPGPSLDLQSGDSYAISQSDLVSYLCCGVPSYELGANQSYLRAAAQVLLPTASSVLAQTLRGQLGSTFDLLQFQPGATDETAPNGQSTGNAASELFTGARFGGDRQITNNLYFSITTGFCQFGQNQPGGSGTGVNSFVEQLETKLQYRFPNLLSAEVGLEPPSSAIVCGRSQRGLVPTPQQWGLSLSKTWRW